ncbi:DeoR/GlpR transcriptional regulator (plasmid) [Phyllobacterium sp. 628]|uniref:DeoR/GlpR family DNA-binding transcription regulator n=1 Tax=Phyllobacterium sp. 628 TaxID=2718938 RepID=UPI0016628A83|nr:DeoR/GlpR family DNA-binding transcription regulator [Phyllobacterium sp. 628]QND55151.1 DeoR/GlpR transcriptional regulator [Phyllobacterium sp. 628]
MSESNPQASRALAPRRHDEILKRVAADGSVSIADLARFFDVSRETIRRDLKILADKGQFELIHGGAARLDAVEPGLSERARENARGKAEIGKLAAALVKPDMVVFLDSGTTTLAVAHALGALRQPLTVCTSSLAIALFMCHLPNVRVHILGGEINPDEEAASGMDVLQAAEAFRIDIAFLGGGAVTPEGDVTDFTKAGSVLRSRMLALVQKAYFVIDSSKFGRSTPLRIADSHIAAAIVTDQKPGDILFDILTDKGIGLIFPLE